MTRPDGASGASGAAFAANFRAVCKEAADYIHQLACVEEAYGYFETSASTYSSTIEHPESDLEVQVIDSDASIPTDYPFKPPWALTYIFSAGGHNNTLAAEDQIKLAFAQAWRPDAGYLVSQCDLVIHPQTDSMVAGVESLGDAAVNLYDFAAKYDTDGDGSSMPGFAQDLRASWRSGLAGTGFFAFYEDLTDLVTRYSTASLILAATSAGVTNAISQFQRNVLENAEKTRDLARDVLKKWQEFQRPFEITEVDGKSTTLEVLDGVSLATGVLALIPGPQSAALGGVSLTADILGFVAEGILTTKAVALPTSSEIYGALLDALSEGQAQMLDALDALRSGSSAPGGEGDTTSAPVIPFDRFVRDSDGNDGWKPPRVDFS